MSRPPVNKIGALSATALVVASMIGTGAFTTLGIQLKLVPNATALLLLWLVGAVVAWCGAVSYAELGTRLPQSGGEAHFLGKIFHPLLGFLSGWVSLTVGFAGAVALAAMAVGHYLEAFTHWPPAATAAACILLLSAAHSLGTRDSSRIQNALTAVKFLVVLGLGLAGALLPADPLAVDLAPGFAFADLFSAGAAVAMISVFYAFSGFNAAVYIVEEIHRPRRNLPRALVGGTVLVGGLFILLQYGFLRQAGTAALSGEIDVARVAATAMLGGRWGGAVSAVIGILLLTSISAMIWVGPRVVRAMAGGHFLWRWFSMVSRTGVPVRATILQGAVSLFLVLTASFERVLLYSEFVLQLFTFLTVFGLVVLRARGGGRPGYASPLYPLPQIVFLVFSGWSLLYLLLNNPAESLLGLLNVLAGLAAYYLDHEREVRPGRLVKDESRS